LVVAVDACVVVVCDHVVVVVEFSKKCSTVPVLAADLIGDEVEV